MTPLDRRTVTSVLDLSTADAGEVLTLQRAAYVTQARLHHDLDLPPLVESLDALRSRLEHPGTRAWGIREDGRLVAAVRVTVEPPTAELGRLVVAPDRQGRGFGTRLLEHVERTLPDGVTAITLFTGERSEASLRLYARCGYCETHRTTAGHYALVHLRKLVPDPPPAGTDRLGGRG